MAKESPVKAAAAQAVTTAPAPTVSEYEAAEIARNAQNLFGYSPDLATAALRVANIQMCSIDKARTIIKTFAERKV